MKINFLLDKLGKQISFVRFLYIALNKERFKETILSELMPPFDKDGKSPLWEAIGRRFLNMEYHEADILSRSNKEFILSLYPSDNIYMTLLPMEARDSIGKVGEDTAPVKKMLEKIGFEYTNEIDPFDGGPHYKCNRDSIKPVKETQLFKADFEELTGELKDVLFSFTHPKYSFLALKTKAKVEGAKIILPKEIGEKYSLKAGVEISAIVF